MKNQKENQLDNHRREFLILSTTIPLLLIPTPSKAFFPALIFRFFARILFRKIIRKGIRQLIKPSIKKGSKNVNIQRVLKVNKQINDLVDVTDYLSDQVWDKNKKNYSTLLISNPTDKVANTGDISLNMYDTDSNSIDFKTQIGAIDIPPNSTVIVEMLFKNIDTSGMKRVYGKYDDKIYASGNILVDSDIEGNGLTIEELYKRRDRERTDSSLRLNPNIII